MAILPQPFLDEDTRKEEVFVVVEKHCQDLIHVVYDLFGVEFGLLLVAQLNLYIRMSYIRNI